MPEGPEVHISAAFVQLNGSRYKFGGKINKSEVSTKNPDIEWLCKEYSIDATSRGKEMKIFLTDVNNKQNNLSILFHFGMSGKFSLTSVDELPKHAHLQFYTVDGLHVLSFVDYRRFGRWFIDSDWGKDRGPCFLTEYQLFRDHVFNCLDKNPFQKPICEVLLDQRYFNGVGNYLRAEALYRLQIKPFSLAKDVLLPLSVKQEIKSDIKQEKDIADDILSMLHKLGNEVVQISINGNGYYYGGEKAERGKSDFAKWLQCYDQKGMKSLKDSKDRTIWFSGDPGSLYNGNKNEKGNRTRKVSKKPSVSNKTKIKADLKEETLSHKKKIHRKIKKEIVLEELKEEGFSEVKTRKNTKQTNKNTRKTNNAFKDEINDVPKRKVRKIVHNNGKIADNDEGNTESRRRSLRLRK